MTSDAVPAWVLLLCCAVPVALLIVGVAIMVKVDRDEGRKEEWRKERLR